MTLSRVVFLDPTAPRAYGDATLRYEGLGGAEATVLRIAGALARRDHHVVVAQAARAHAEVGRVGVLYLPWDTSEPLPGMRDAQVVVVLRAHKLLPRVRQQYPHARLFLWLHAFPGHRRRALAACAAKAGATVVAVSETHKRAVRDFALMKDPRHGPFLDVIRIYSAVADGLVRDATPWDPDKLVLTGAPHKGLDDVLEAFRFLHHRWPSLSLYLASDGPVTRSLAGDLFGVVPLGSLPPHEVTRHTREALCLFSPQASFQESFGLAFAEANAVGTPVLAHKSGAAPEVITGTREQLVDARALESIAQVVERWRGGARPLVTTNPAFRLSHVIADWEAAFARPWNPAGIADAGAASAAARASP